MRPTDFEYHKAGDLDHALQLLAEFGEDGRPIAGGQSLVPMMNLRLARPSHLVDITGLGLDAIERSGETVRIGALVRHERYFADPLVTAHFPAFVEGVRAIGHPTIRRNGTIGGSLAHCDPTAELPLLTMLYDGTIVAASARGERRIEATAFFEGAYMTVLEPDEMIVAVELPLPPTGQSSAFVEMAERRGDFAIAACGLALTPAEGRISRAAVAVSGCAQVAMRAPRLEEALDGLALNGADATAAIADYTGTLSPPSDHSASADYRRALIAELLDRALKTACARAMEAT